MNIDLFFTYHFHNQCLYFRYPQHFYRTLRCNNFSLSWHLLIIHINLLQEAILYCQSIPMNPKPNNDVIILPFAYLSLYVFQYA